MIVTSIILVYKVIFSHQVVPVYNHLFKLVVNLAEVEEARERPPWARSWLRHGFKPLKRNVETIHWDGGETEPQIPK
jgi:hypothetical protein